MAEVVLFHHVQGLTDGVRAFAEELRAGGHTVHTPDLFEGARPESIDDGMALTEKIGDEVLSARADGAVADLPDGLVYAGFSFGVGEAQRLAQTRRGARGALLNEGCFPITGEWAFGPWPDAVPVQIHGMDGTRSSGKGATSMPPASWSRSSATSWRSCSCTPATDTCLPTAPSRRTTPRRQRWWRSARASSSTA